MSTGEGVLVFIQPMLDRPYSRVLMTASCGPEGGGSRNEVFVCVGPLPVHCGGQGTIRVVCDLSVRKGQLSFLLHFICEIDGWCYSACGKHLVG